jgi:Tat protein translocase TatB subunit
MNQSEGCITTMEFPATIQAASIGIPDTLLLMLLALVVFGPRRLPEIGRQIGKLMYEFRKVSNEFKYQMEEELRASEEADRQKKLQATVAASSQVTLRRGSRAGVRSCTAGAWRRISDSRTASRDRSCSTSGW